MDKQVVDQYLSQAARTGGMESPFLKLPQGIHRLRIIPGGNRLEPGINFRKMVQHHINYGQDQADFFICWNYIASNVQLVGAPLSQQGVLTKGDVDLYRQHGCPGCKWEDFMRQAGVEKKVADQARATDQYLWPVLHRDMRTMGGVVRVWKNSTTLWKEVLALVDQFAGRDPFDINAGYDISLSAEGERLNRRYKGVSWFPEACALNLPQGAVLPDLIQVGNISFKNYQETINIMKKKYAQMALQMGYSFPGDMVGNTYPSGPPNVYPSPQQNYAVGHQTPQNTVNYGQVQREGTQFPNPMLSNQAQAPALNNLAPSPYGQPVQYPPNVSGVPPQQNLVHPVQPQQGYGTTYQQPQQAPPPMTVGQAPTQFNSAEEFAAWQEAQQQAQMQQYQQLPPNTPYGNAQGMTPAAQPQQGYDPTPQGQFPTLQQHQAMWNQGQAGQAQGTFPPQQPQIQQAPTPTQDRPVQVINGVLCYVDTNPPTPMY